MGCHPKGVMRMTLRKLSNISNNGGGNELIDIVKTTKQVIDGGKWVHTKNSAGNTAYTFHSDGKPLNLGELEMLFKLVAYVAKQKRRQYSYWFLKSLDNFILYWNQDAVFTFVVDENNLVRAVNFSVLTFIDEIRSYALIAGLSLGDGDGSGIMNLMAGCYAEYSGSVAKNEVVRLYAVTMVLDPKFVEGMNAFGKSFCHPYRPCPQGEISFVEAVKERAIKMYIEPCFGVVQSGGRPFLIDTDKKKLNFNDSFDSIKPAKNKRVDDFVKGYVVNPEREDFVLVVDLFNPASVIKKPSLDELWEKEFSKRRQEGSFERRSLEAIRERVQKWKSEPITIDDVRDVEKLMISRDWLGLGELEKAQIKNSIIFVCGAGVSAGAVISLLKIGFRRIIVADGDVLELHNVGLSRNEYRAQKHVGKNKALAIKSICDEMFPENDVVAYPYYVSTPHLQTLIPLVDVLVNAIDFEKEEDYMASHSLAREYGVVEIFPFALGRHGIVVVNKKGCPHFDEYLGANTPQQRQDAFVKFALGELEPLVSEVEWGKMTKLLEKYEMSKHFYRCEPQCPAVVTMLGAYISKIIVDEVLEVKQGIQSSYESFPKLNRC